jgi:divalent metal cation (Fe/Co/Zn/Cd) transporter
MAHGSKRAVGAAIVGNGTVTVAKFFAFLVTGSAAMLSESLHSLADALEEAIRREVPKARYLDLETD